MDRKDFLSDAEQAKFYDTFLKLHKTLDNAFLEEHNRSLPMADALLDRWERARKLGFGEGTSVYDSCLIIGDVKVGGNCWIGPFTVIDGSGGLEIGDYCTVSAGVHIYTHDNVKKTLSSGSIPIERNPVKIGNNVYLAPNVVIAKGVNIGSICVIGANAFVNKDIPSHSIAMGQPAKVVGKIETSVGGEVSFRYF